MRRLDRVLALRRGPLIQRIAMLATGAGAAQVITMAFAPVLTRLYSPAEFGVFGVYSSVLSVVAVSITLRYELAIMLPESPEDAAGVFALSLLVACASTILAVALLVPLRPALVSLLGSDELGGLLWLLPASMLVYGVSHSVSCWATRQKEFASLSRSKVVRASATGAQQLAGGLMYWGGLGLVLGQLVGQLAASVALCMAACRRDMGLIRASVSRASLVRVARRYQAFPRYSAPQAVINSLSQNVPAFALVYMFGSEVVGLYAMAIRLLRLPIEVVTQAVRQVFLQRASEAVQAEEDLFGLYLRSTLGLALTGLLPAVLVVVTGPYMFEVFLGPQWRVAGEYARWLMPWLYSSLVNPPGFALTVILEKQQLLLGLDVALLVLRLVGLAIGGVLRNPLLALALFSFAGLLVNCILIGTMGAKAWERGHTRTSSSLLDTVSIDADVAQTGGCSGGP